MVCFLLHICRLLAFDVATAAAAADHDDDSPENSVRIKKNCE